MCVFYFFVYIKNKIKLNLLNSNNKLEKRCLINKIYEL